MDERTEVRAPDLLFSAILVNLLAARVCVRSSCKLRLASKWLGDEREGDGFGSVFCFRVCSLASGIMSQPESGGDYHLLLSRSLELIKLYSLSPWGRCQTVF